MGLAKKTVNVLVGLLLVISLVIIVFIGGISQRAVAIPSSAVLRKGPNWEDVWCTQINSTHKQCMMMAGEGINNVPNQEGKLERFIDVYSAKWENGMINVSWWSGFVGIVPLVNYSGNVYTVAQVKQAYPGVDMKSFVYKTGSYKYGFNFSDVPENVVNKSRILLQLGKTQGVSWSDVSKSGGRIFVKDRFVLDFRDLISAGFTVELVNKTTVSIGNLSGKTVFSLDPTISPQPGDTVGVDAVMVSSAPDTNYPTLSTFMIGNEGASVRRSVMQVPYTTFGLVAANVSSIDELIFGFYVVDNVQGYAAMHALYTCFIEDEVTWNINSTGGKTWTGGESGVDYNATAVQNSTFGSTGWVNYTAIDGDNQFKGDNCGYIFINNEEGGGSAITFGSSSADTGGQEPIYFITYTILVGNAGPTWLYNTTNASTITKTGLNVSWGINLSDDIGLNYSFLVVNGTDDLFHNTTLVALNGVTSIVLNETNITGMVHNDKACAYFWFNDTDGESNESGTTCFVVANTLPPSPASITPVSGNQTTNNITLTCAAVTDADAETVYYEIYGDTSATPTTKLQNTSSNTYSWTLTASGVYYYRCRAHDSYDASAGYTSAKYRYVDFEAPQIGNDIYNNASTVTKVSGVVNWTINISDDMSLSYAWLEENATTTSSGGAVLKNQSLISLGNAEVFNVSQKVTVAVKRGNYSCGRFWFNDTSNNVNSSGWSCFDVANSVPTTPSTVSPGNGTNISVSSQVLTCSGSNDADNDVITYIFYGDANNPPQTTINTSTITTALFDFSASDVYYWICGANDSSDYSTNTSTMELYVDFQAPTWTNILNNASTVTKINGVVNWTANISDEMSLSYAWLEHNATDTSGGLPVLKNESVSELGSSTNYNISKQITVLMKRGNYTCGRFWFNDTSNNVNSTDWSCFVVANSQPTTPAITYPEDYHNYSLSSIGLNTSGSTDSDNDLITYYFYINGTLNSTSTTNSTYNSSGDGTYSLKVASFDGIVYSSNSTTIVFTLDTTSPPTTEEPTIGGGTFGTMEQKCLVYSESYKTCYHLGSDGVCVRGCPTGLVCNDFFMCVDSLEEPEFKFTEPTTWINILRFRIGNWFGQIKSFLIPDMPTLYIEEGDLELEGIIALESTQQPKISLRERISQRFNSFSARTHLPRIVLLAIVLIVLYAVFYFGFIEYILVLTDMAFIYLRTGVMAIISMGWMAVAVTILIIIWVFMRIRGAL